jgi:hypothetical protein
MRLLGDRIELAWGLDMRLRACAGLVGGTAADVPGMANI